MRFEPRSLHSQYGGLGGKIGSAQRPLFSGPIIILPRKGTLTNPSYCETDCWVIDTAYAAIAHQNVDTKWLFYNLSLANLESLNEATGVPSINRDMLYRLEFYALDFEEQQKIAEILTTVDNLIEQTEAAIAKYQAIKQGMMHDLFTRGVDANGHLRPPREEAPELYKESELGWIPKEWTVFSCKNLCNEIVVGIVVQPTQYYKDHGIHVLRSANIKEEGINNKAWVFMSSTDNQHLSKSMVKHGDLVTIRTGFPGYPGTTCVIPKWLDGSNCVDIIISRPKEIVRSFFLSMWINSYFGRNQIFKNEGGLAQQHFNIGEMKSIKVILPAIAEQDRIVNSIQALENKISFDKNFIYKINKIKSGLMQDLLSGRVRVATADAPAPQEPPHAS